MTQYAKGQRGRGFPPPIARVTTDSPLWDWATVANWFCRKHKLPPDAVAAAETVKRVNARFFGGGR
ncbi:hypothetical protein OCH7691_01614 [Oceanibacterium hippocampi]|uniref:Uncharacterized protein n=2 Tax=Oceanibacterium hippocampi TaxID=745714 RepID=A0A1Y5SG55_9PROT|nr:hypothetical protein OCH7691_01614 [Oceanibacterium hippocampi]